MTERRRAISLFKRLEVTRVCKSTRLRQVFDIVFTRSGAVDVRRSDLS